MRDVSIFRGLIVVANPERDFQYPDFLLTYSVCTLFDNFDICKVLLNKYFWFHVFSTNYIVIDSLNFAWLYLLYEVPDRKNKNLIFYNRWTSFRFFISGDLHRLAPPGESRGMRQSRLTKTP